MKIRDLTEAPIPPAGNMPAAPAAGTNLAGAPTTPQTTGNATTKADQPGQTMDPAAAQKQKQDQKKALQMQLRQAQDAVKAAQDNVKTIQQQITSIQ